MQLEKIIKRDDGNYVRVVVVLESVRLKNGWQVSVYYYGLNNLAYSVPTCQEDAVTPEEILTAKLELWEKIKPV